MPVHFLRYLVDKFASNRITYAAKFTAQCSNQFQQFFEKWNRTSRDRAARESCIQMRQKKKRVSISGHALDGFEYSKPFIDGGVDALPADAVDLPGD